MMSHLTILKAGLVGLSLALVLPVNLALADTPSSTAPGDIVIHLPSASRGLTTPPTAAQATPYVASSASPGDTGGSLRFCSAMPDARERLTCYEDASRREGIVVMPAKGVYGDRGGAGGHFEWSQKTGKNPDGTLVSIAAIETDKVTSSDAPMASDTARAVLRCAGGQMAFYLSFQHPFQQGSLPVTINDGNQERSFTWQTGSSGSSVGLWETATATNMARFLLQSPVVRFTITLPGSQTLAASFDFSDMKAAVSDVRSGCGW